MHKSARAAAGHSHTDAGPDQIVCLLCGETYRAINYWHLKRIHGFEGEHPVQDYKEMYGLRVAACQDVCDRQREVQVERHKKAGRHWSKARIMREIRRRRSVKHGLAMSRVPVALGLAARRAYGSWEGAVRAAGTDPVPHRLRGTWDRERVVAEIGELARRGGRLTGTDVERHHPELHGAAFRTLGNWSTALRAAGLDPSRHRKGKKWTIESVADWVRRTHAKGGDIRQTAAPNGAAARVAHELGLRWSAYVESLGIPYPGQVKRLDWTRRTVLAEIRRLQRAGLPLNDRAMRDQSPGLVQQARQRFGSWDAALRAVGLDPARIRLTRVWTRQDVLAAIRKRKRAGKSLQRKAVFADDPRLVKAAVRLFPTSWNRALAAAGLGDDRHGRGPARLGPRGPDGTIEGWRDVMLVVLLRGVNVGGHKTFRPAELPRELHLLRVLNVGAAGTFVVRRAPGRRALRAEIVRRFPSTRRS
ncbi:MAG: hypothetical protein AB7I45_17485 [Planctomycetota bacterium]